MLNVSTIAVIGGTGMNQWPGLEVEQRLNIRTPYGAPSAPLLAGKIHGMEVVFLARHGEGHKVPPHLINYRANLWALHSIGVRDIIAIAAVGGIGASMPPAALAVPHDLIDYTWGREHTCCDGFHAPLKHVEFTEPFSERVRRELLHAALAAGVDIVDGGVVGVTQGPRLESTAEISRMKRDGCDMVGMTSMPEAGLARELNVNYGTLALSVNWAAGMGSGDIHAEIERCISEGMDKVRRVLARALPALVAQD